MAVNVLEQYAAKNIMWGISESVVVHGDRVFSTPAGAKGLMVAHDKRTGAPLWASPALDGEKASYSSPILINAGNRKLLVNGGMKYVFAVDAESGVLVWQLPQADPNNTVNTTPVLSGGRLLTNSSRGYGAAFGVQIGDGSASRAWTTELSISHGGTICVDGQLCGSSSRGEARGWVTGQCGDRQTDAGERFARWFVDLRRGAVLLPERDGHYDSAGTDECRISDGRLVPAGRGQRRLGSSRAMPGQVVPPVSRHAVLLRSEAKLTQSSKLLLKMASDCIHEFFW